MPNVTKFSAGSISFESEGSGVINFEEGNSCKIITLIGFEIVKTNVKHGEYLIVKYEICNPNNAPTVVGLGMSVRPDSWFYGEMTDPDNDDLVLLKPGIEKYERKFYIQENSELGVYDLALAIWSSEPGKHDKIHNTKWLKQKFIVE